MQIKRETTVDIINIVKILKKKYGSWNPFYIATRLGIKYTFLNFEGDLLAFSEKDNNLDLGRIYISQNIGLYAQKLLSAHELGHLLMHECGHSLFNECIDPEREFEANYFMARLIPGFFNDIYQNCETVEEFNRLVSNVVNFVIKNEKSGLHDEKYLNQSKTEVIWANYPSGQKRVKFDYVSGNIEELFILP